MTDRCQLNLRLDGRRDLLETIKDVAAVEGLSVNAWVVKTLEQATTQTTTALPIQSQTQVSEVADIESVLNKLLDIKLDTVLAAKLGGIEERLGKLRA